MLPRVRLEDYGVKTVETFIFFLLSYLAERQNSWCFYLSHLPLITLNYLMSTFLFFGTYSTSIESIDIVFFFHER